MRWSIILLAAISSTAFAESNLYKCTINGKVTYTDAPTSACQQLTPGAYPRSPQPPKVKLDGVLYDRQTAREIIRYRQSKAEEVEQQRVEIPVAEQPRPRVDMDKIRELSGKGRAGRNAARVLLGEPQQEDDPVPTVITSCNSGGCYDTTGMFHPGSPDGTMTSPDGKVCRNNGGMLSCN